MIAVYKWMGTDMGDLTIMWVIQVPGLELWIQRDEEVIAKEKTAHMNYTSKDWKRVYMEDSR